MAGAAFEAAGLGVVVVSAAEAIGGFAETLFDEPNVIVAGPDSHWAKRRSLKLADLIKERWVLAQPGSLARSLHDDTFRRNGFEPPSATVLTVWLDLYMRTMTPLAERASLIAPERSQTQSQFARYPNVCCHVHEGNTGLSAVISTIDQCGQGLGGSH